jgi:hypothetical protein
METLSYNFGKVKFIENKMSSTIPITINLPQELVKASQELIRLGKAKNLEDFISLALQKEIAQNNLPLVLSNEEDPIFGLGKNPVNSGVKDASENLDNYLYKL